MMERVCIPVRVKVMLTLLLTLPCLGAQCDGPLFGPMLQFEDLLSFNGSGYCQDWGLGEIFHPDQQCYRQENCLFNCPQVCEDRDGNRVNSRDLVSPVIGRNSGGRCVYDTPWDPWTGIGAHFSLWGHAILDVLLAPLSGLGH